jgi:hypothetical protein
MRHLLSTLTIFTLLTASTLHAQVPSYVPTDGLVGWWPFNGNANDESGNGNNGVVNGATLVEDRIGNTNSAYSFSNSYILVSPFDELIGNNPFSVSFWSLASGGGWMIACGQINNGNGFDAGNNNNGIGNFHAHIYKFGHTSSLTPIPNNEWVNIVIVYSNMRMKVYRNNILTMNDTVDYVVPNLLPGTLQFGKQLLFNEYFQGLLDDIGIWNRALTPTEIQALYNAQDGPCVSPDPVSFTGLGSSYTLADAPVTLAGSPAGGVFIGPGVSGSTFSPAAAGVGTHGISYTYLDGDNCVNTFSQCTEVTINAGIGGNAMTTGGVRVFPNPNAGQFTVELELVGLVGLQVFDARGALVHNEVFTASGSRTQRTLDLSAFAKGSYTLQVEHDGQRITQTVVVE